MTTDQYIGKSTDRLDGRAKVTGQARYAGEFLSDELVYGYVVQSTIATGKINDLDISAAEAVPGVLRVFTHENIPKEVKINADYSDPIAPPGHPFRPLYNSDILFNDQPIALVVAENFETARYAAGLVSVSYSESEYVTDLHNNMDRATREEVSGPPDSRGNAEAIYEKADIKIEAIYSQPRHYHNPMEPHVSIAKWDEDNESFEIYDKIQGVRSSQIYIAGIFGLEMDQVHVRSPFVGGGFGSGLRPQYQLFLAAVAAKALGRPVKVEMTRRQMFSFGHRPATVQHLKLSADDDGKLTSIQHAVFGETSSFEKFSEEVAHWSGLMYQCDHVQLDYQLVPLDVYTPMDMRGPGGATGMYALECAMDELAEAVGIDPLELRLINYADKDQLKDLPFSSKELRACYEQAAQRFGWENRKATPGSIQRDNQWIGYGMATGVWEATQQKASAQAELHADGRLIVSSATADIGTGTYTVMSQIAAETLGIDLQQVSFELGDTNLPRAPIEGGSWTVSSVGTAVKLACEKLKKELFTLARQIDADRCGRLAYEDITFADGQMIMPQQETLSYTDILKAANQDKLTVNFYSRPAEERKQYSCYAHSCIMVEVNVDKDLGMITVPRVVSAVAGGRIINPKTAESQVLGGLVWGISMALEEEGMMDDRLGRIMNANLAEYHVAVQADIQQLEVIFVEEEDEIVNPLGAKGLGEIGLVGVAAAIANAVYNATGNRVRELPITLDKLLTY